MTYQLVLEFREEAISGLLNMIYTKLISQKLIRGIIINHHAGVIEI